MSVKSSKTIEHKGIIKDINARVVTVALKNVSACGSCHAKDACYIAENDTKTVEVANPHEGYSLGDAVTVVLERSQGFKALFFGYLLPFIIFMTALIVASNLIAREEVVGIIAIGAIIPYYLSLYFFKKRLQRTFTFRLRK